MLQANLQPRFKRWIEFNTLYFFPLGALLIWAHITSLFLVQDPSPFSTLPFLIATITQCLVEILFTILACDLVKKISPKKGFHLFLFLSFWLFMAQIADLPLLRIMGKTVWEYLFLLQSEPFDNLIEIFRASNISLSSWLTAFISLLLFSGIGNLLYSLTAKRGSMKLSLKLTLLSFLASFAFLLFWDFVSIAKTSPYSYETHRKTLPFKGSFFSPPLPALHVNLEKVLERPNLSLSIQGKKPPIFLFVIESLRQDFITESVAPHLTSFKKENISFDLALSGGNATHLSWFSIFHSEFPLHWSQHDSAHLKTGSLPLKLLKEAGYKIHCYTTPSLAFYDTGTMIFGEGYSLADSVETFLADKNRAVWECDKLAMEALLNDAEKNGEAHLYILFLDATHFGYSWPSEETLFTPIVEKINYLRSSCSHHQKEEIKNRYRNAIHFVDKLIGNFLARLPDPESILIITGDHGEEFHEEGYLFHASNLSPAQTEIPLFYKFGTSSKRPTSLKLSSHLDIFPTLLDYLSEGSLPLSSFKGSSIFSSSPKPFALSVKYNAGNHPFEFSILKDSQRLTLLLDNPKDIYQSKQVKILSLKDAEGRLLPINQRKIADDFQDALSSLHPTP